MGLGHDVAGLGGSSSVTAISGGSNLNDSTGHIVLGLTLSKSGSSTAGSIELNQGNCHGNPGDLYDSTGTLLQHFSSQCVNYATNLITGNYTVVTVGTAPGNPDYASGAEVDYLAGHGQGIYVKGSSVRGYVKNSKGVPVSEMNIAFTTYLTPVVSFNAYGLFEGAGIAIYVKLINDATGAVIRNDLTRTPVVTLQPGLYRAIAYGASVEEAGSALLNMVIY